MGSGSLHRPSALTEALVDLEGLVMPPPGWYCGLRQHPRGDGSKEALVCVGAASVEEGGGAVLTPAESGQVGALWTSQPLAVSQGFEVTIYYTPTPVSAYCLHTCIPP